MTGFWSRTSATSVVAAVAARQSVVVTVATGGLDACNAELLAEVGDGNMKLGKVLKGNDELYVGGSAVGSEGTIGCSEICDRGTITGSGRHKVGNGFDRFILIGVIDQLESGTGRGGLQLPTFLVGSCEELLEACPGLVVSWPAPP